MIPSGTLAIDPAAHAASSAAVRLRLEHLEERRRCAELSVDHVLATWRGDAAERFRNRWEEWNRGALAVIDQLSGAVEQLDQVRRDLSSADDRSGELAGRIAGRLG